MGSALQILNFYKSCLRLKVCLWLTTLQLHDVCKFVQVQNIDKVKRSVKMPAMTGLYLALQIGMTYDMTLLHK